MLNDRPAMDRNTFLVIIAFVLFFLSFSPIYHELIQAWTYSSNNSHGLLVPVLSGYLVWQKKAELTTADVGNYKWGLVILILSMLGYVVSYAGAIAVISRTMIVTGLMGLILYNFGKEIFTIIAFPICYLLFMVPVPDSIYQVLAFPLQLFASQISAALIGTVNIPVLREGNMLYFANAQLEVAEACSGLRSLTSYIMLSSLFAYMIKENWVKRLFFVFSAFPLALIANIVRITGTGILAHFIGGKAAQGFLHEFSGIVVFLFGFALMLTEYLILERTGARKSAGH